MIRQWHGIYPAVVYSNADPQNMNRVQLKIPQVLGTAVSQWAIPLALSGSAPDINTPVAAMFLGGDVSHPCYLIMG